MKTITLNVYSFNELSDKAKKVAIDNKRNNKYRLCYDWWGKVYEDFSEKAKEIGINNADFVASVAYSQSDYAHFCNGDIDLEKVIDILDISIKPNLKEIFLSVTEAEMDKDGKIYVATNEGYGNYTIQSGNYLKKLF